MTILMLDPGRDGFDFAAAIDWCKENNIPPGGTSGALFVDTTAKIIIWQELVTPVGDKVWMHNGVQFFTAVTEQVLPEHGFSTALNLDWKTLGSRVPGLLSIGRVTPLLTVPPAHLAVGGVSADA